MNVDTNFLKFQIFLGILIISFAVIFQPSNSSSDKPKEEKVKPLEPPFIIVDMDSFSGSYTYQDKNGRREHFFDKNNHYKIGDTL
jgi:uncharacterized membrane protein